MKVTRDRQALASGACAILALLMPLSALAMPPQQQTNGDSANPAAPVQSAPAVPPASTQPAAPLPDSPGAVYAQNLAQAQAVDAQQSSVSRTREQLSNR